MRAALSALLLLSTLAGTATPASSPPTGPLHQGNRLFAEGDLEAALAAYASGWSDSEPDPLLAYNLGTTALHLGRLPEALLWYRRAEAATTRKDPWLEENLEIVRGSLELPPSETASAWNLVLGKSWSLTVLGAVLAWTTLGLILLKPRMRRQIGAVALFACSAFASGLLLEIYGPRAAVLLAPCDLPAGSEVMVLPAGGEAWRVIGTDRQCLREAVGLIAP